MSGHSKWSTIKRKKGAADAKRGQLFGKLARYITVAAREGGGDPKTNIALEQAIQKAKDNNMPSDNIDRAIKRGTGDVEGARYENVIYEGYGTAGVALMIETMTDNRNRTTADVRSYLTKHGGSLGISGCVSYMFARRGHMIIDKEVSDEDTVMTIALEAGAEDVADEETHWEILATPENLREVRAAFEQAGIEFRDCEITYIPDNTITLNRDQSRKILKLIDFLEDLDDVTEVFGNFDIPEEILEELAEE